MEEPLSGAVPVAAGMSSLVRIPIPGTNGLCIELQPRGFVPRGGSTSTLFFQDKTGKRTLRLDYGYNVKTKSVDYHWNQKGTHDIFGIADHQPAGRWGPAWHRGARYFRYAGRTLFVVGIAVDTFSIVVADKPLRRSTAVVSAWAMAWVGCKTVGAGAAMAGTLVGPKGTAIGGIAGCVVGGIGGYIGGEKAGEVVYDWAEDTVFRTIPASPQPPGFAR